MFEFPPPIWTNQDWTFGGLALIVVFGLMLPLIVARFTSHRPWMATVWVVVGVISLCAFGNYFLYGSETYEPDRYMMAMPGLLSVVCAVFAFRIWWRSSEGAARLHEGIVIVLIVMVLFNLVLPASSTPRRVGWRQTCKNNLKQIGLAMHNYHDHYGLFPAAALGSPPVSWRISLLPYLEHAEVAGQYDRNQPWDSFQNVALQKKRIQLYECRARPSQYDSQGRFLTSYVVPTTRGAIFDSAGGTPISEIKDGTSNTLLTLEACGTEIIWTDPRDVDSSNGDVLVNGPGAVKGRSSSMISSWHPGGAQVGLADGSVRFVDKNIDAVVLKNLMTKAGGEDIEEW
jgi:prepilin-type processing-associated H-X9-DG protein